MGSELIAAAKIDIPQAGFRFHAFKSNFARVARSRLPNPYDPKLAFLFTKLNFEHFSKPNLSPQSLD